MTLKVGGARQNYASDKTCFLASSNAAFNLGTGDALLAGWVYRNSTGQQVIMAKYQNSSNYWRFEIDASHHLHFICVVSGVTQIEITGTTALSSTSTWYFVAVAVDRSSASGCKVYINGTNDTAGTPTTSGTNADNTGGLYVCQGGADALYWDGRIQSLMVAKPSDVTSIVAAALASLYGDRQPKYYGELTASERTNWGVTLYYNCNEGNSTDGLVDQHGSNDGTLTVVSVLTDGELETWASATDLTYWIEVVAGSSTVNREGTVIHGGTYSVRLDVDGSNNVASIYQTPGSTGGLSYTYRFWAKSDSGTPQIWVGDNLGTFNYHTLSSSWTEYTGTYTPRAGLCVLLVTTNNAAGRSIYIDDISLTVNECSAANGVASAIVSDSVGSNDGVLTGFSTTQLTTSWSTDVPSVPSCAAGYSLSFDGVDDYVAVSGAVDLRFNSGSSDFTIAMWFKTSDVTQYLLDIRDADDDGYCVLLTAAGLAQFYLDAIDVTGSGSDLTDNAWHHLGVVVDRDGNIQIYVDGVANGTPVACSSEEMDVAGNLRFGSDYSGTDFYYGQLDDVRIYSSALTAGQMAALAAGYDTDPDWPGDPTAAWWKCDDGYQSQPVDGDPLLSWESNHSDRSAFQQATAASRPTYNYQALNGRSTVVFDGTDDHLDYVGSLNLDTLGTLAIVFTTGASAFAADQTLFASADAGSANVYFQVGIDAAGNCFVEVNDSGTVHRATGNTVLSTSASYLLVVRSDGSTWDMQVNGVAQTLTITGSNSGKWLGDLAGRDNCTLGALVASSTTDYFEGEIAEVSPFSTRLSDANLGTLEDYVIDRYDIAMP